ncbi:calcium-binding protein [Paracoccus sp. (in: a-proteobacteria)]|uniref:calcium-binding protein n=1 Tax=Paracoccus sp. TaxID=267 RepID=UPI003A8C3B58
MTVVYTEVAFSPQLLNFSGILDGDQVGYQFFDDQEIDVNLPAFTDTWVATAIAGPIPEVGPEPLTLMLYVQGDDLRVDDNGMLIDGTVGSLALLTPVSDTETTYIFVFNELGVEVADFVAAASSPGGEDDLALIYTRLRYDDFFTLSEFDDVAHGFDGEDIMSGLHGNDTLYGGNGEDQLYGEEGDDRLMGGGSDDGIEGGLGNDRIVGGRGEDLLTGSEGRDLFVFRSVRDSQYRAPDDLTDMTLDEITDFTQGEDRISLGQIDANSLTPENEAFRFMGDDGLTSSGIGEVTYSHRERTIWSGETLEFTLVRVDTDADARPEMSFRISDHIDLTAEDFIL